MSLGLRESVVIWEQNKSKPSNKTSDTFHVIIGDGSGWDPLRACWTGSLEHMVLVARLEEKNYMLDVGLGLIAVRIFQLQFKNKLTLC